MKSRSFSFQDKKTGIHLFIHFYATYLCNCIRFLSLENPEKWIFLEKRIIFIVGKKFLTMKELISNGWRHDISTLPEEEPSEAVS